MTHLSPIDGHSNPLMIRIECWKSALAIDDLQTWGYQGVVDWDTDDPKSTGPCRKVPPVSPRID